MANINSTSRHKSSLTNEDDPLVVAGIITASVVGTILAGLFVICIICMCTSKPKADANNKDHSEEVDPEAGIARPIPALIPARSRVFRDADGDREPLQCIPSITASLHEYEHPADESIPDYESDDGLPGYAMGAPVFDELAWESELEFQENAAAAAAAAYQNPFISSYDRGNETDEREGNIDDQRRTGMGRPRI